MTLTAASRPLSYAQRTVHQLVTTLPPVRGLNSTGAVALMSPQDAIEMDNFIAGDFGVAMRGGWYEYATHIGLDFPIKTIMSFEGMPAGATISPLSTSELFAATDTGIWNIEGGGDFTGVAADVVLSGANEAGRFSTVQFITDSGPWLVACSETEGGYLYNGVVWIKMTSVGGPGPGIITGVDPVKFVQVTAYKNRLMFVERASTVVWFLPVGAVGGVASKFDFGPLLQHGGSVLAIANWTQDAGQGTDDRLVVLGSSGDLLVYEGNDPSSASGFACAGVWYIGQPPVGRRFFTTSGGNIMVLTSFGVIPVGQVVQGGLDNILTSQTDYLKQLRMLQDQLKADFFGLLNTVGWEVLALPDRSMLMIARPSQVQNEFVQYVFEQHNLAWSRLLDVPGETFALRLREVYAGTGDGRVVRMLEGETDGMLLDGTGAHEIRAKLTPAFNYFGDPTVRKQALMMRVNFLANQNPAYSVAMNVDFSTSQNLGSFPPLTPPAGSLWDHARWDASYWAGTRVAYGEWRSVVGFGFALAPTLYVSSVKATTIANIEYMVKPAGPV